MFGFAMYRRSVGLPALFVLVMHLVVAGAYAEGWGDLSGQFVFDGQAPVVAPIPAAAGVGVCAGAVDESLLVDADTKGISNVVVFLYQKKSDAPPEVHPDYDSKADSALKFDNVNCLFQPRIVGLRTTQKLEIGNLDSTGHNVNANCVANPAFNLLIPANQSLERKFAKAERLPVPISCNIHPWMKGFVVVKENPYFAVTDKQGRFKIKNLPVGNWTFQFWHERTGYVKEVEVGGVKKEWKKGRLPVNIAAAGVDLGKITLAAKSFK